MANRQTTIAQKIRAFVGPNKILYFNKKGGFRKYINDNPISVNENCVFELMDPLEMSDDLIEALARDTDMSVEDIKAEIGMFRYDISQKMPVSLASLLAQGRYDSPVYGKSLLGSGLAVTSIIPLIEEYDRTHQHKEELQPF
jgi:hypothetical protein